MEWLSRWRRRIHVLLHGRDAERAMDDELRHYIECEVTERIRAGAGPEEARRAVLVDFGGIEQVKEDARDARGVRPLEDLAADIRYGARVLRRSPGFAAAAVLTFALGSGAASAIFSVVYGVLLRPLPYRDPAHLVVVWERNVARNADHNVVSVANFEAWRDRSRAFAGMAGLVPRPVTIANDAGPDRLMGAEVSPGYFGMLGVAPALGRDFGSDDGRADSAPVVILSHGLWKRRFAADPGVVGRMLPIVGTPHRIVGVMPAGFEPPRVAWLTTQEMWFPFKPTAENRSWGRFLIVVARRQPDVSLEQARAEMGAIADQLAREDRADEGWAVSVVPLAAQITGDVRAALVVVLGAVCLLLLIAVVNVATLSASLARRRAHELATRRTLGATEGRLFRQLLTQSALVGLMGAAVALVAVAPLVRLLVRLAPPDVPRLESIRVDAPVLLVTMSVTLLATFVSGALAAAGGRAGTARSLLAPEAGDGRTSGRVGGSGLVAVEIAVALALATMAMLMARSFAGLRAVDLGFQSDGVVAARVAWTDASPERARALFDSLQERVRALPGVQSAGRVSTRPLGGRGPATEVSAARPGPGAWAGSIVADIRWVDDAFFRTLRIPVAQGRAFDAREPAQGPPRVVISESLAAALWPGQDAVGRQARLVLYGGIDAEVIGVVPDLHLMDPRTPARPSAYLSDVRFPSDTRDVMVRVSGNPSPIVPALRSAVAALDPGTPLYQVETMPRLVDASVAADRFTMVLLAAFAALALALSAVGVFGVISSEVTRRRREIGIRMALGAAPSAVAGMLLRQALGRASIGVVAGLVLAALLARAMQALLFDIAATDPVSFLTVAPVVLGIVTLATLIPARRAIQSSPLSVLREG
jgi:predicted permease